MAHKSRRERSSGGYVQALDRFQGFLICSLAILALALIKGVCWAVVSAAIAIIIVDIVKSPKLYTIYTSSRMGWFRSLCGLLTKFLAWFNITWLQTCIGIKRSKEESEVINGILKLHQDLDTLATKSIPEKIFMAKVAMTLKAPLFFLQWALLGMLIPIIKEDRAMLIPEELWRAHAWPELDWALACLFFVYALRNILDTEAKERLYLCADSVVDSLEEQLFEIDGIGDLPEYESKIYIADYVEELRRKKYVIRSFYRNGYSFYEQGLNILTIWVFLFCFVSTIATTIGLVATYVITANGFGRLRNLTEDKKLLFQDRARRSALETLASEDGGEALRHAISVDGAYDDTIKEYTQHIQEGEIANLEDGVVARRIAVWLYYTLIQLSVLFPLLAIHYGLLQFRVGLLYLFATIGNWNSINRMISSAEVMLDGYNNDLDQIEEIFAILKYEQQSMDQREQRESIEITSSEIVFQDPRFHYPFRGGLLRWVSAVTIKPTVSVSAVVKIVAAPGSGTSTLIKMITGEIRPDEGEILYGDIPIQEASFEERRRAIKSVADNPPKFPARTTAFELFRAVCGKDITEDWVNHILGQFELAEEFQVGGNPKYTGANFIYEGRQYQLRDQLRRQLWLALCYAGIRRQHEMKSKAIKVIAVDGIDKLTSRTLRDKVTQNFVKLANDLQATLVTSVRTSTELTDNDYVLRIIPREMIPESFDLGELDNYKGSIVIGCNHDSYWSHVDRTRRDTYRTILAKLDQTK